MHLPTLSIESSSACTLICPLYTCCTEFLPLLHSSLSFAWGNKQSELQIWLKLKVTARQKWNLWLSGSPDKLSFLQKACPEPEGMYTWQLSVLYSNQVYSEECVNGRLVLGKPTASPLMSVQRGVSCILQDKKIWDETSDFCQKYLQRLLLIYG